MANEFIIRKGYKSLSSSEITGSLLIKDGSVNIPYGSSYGYKINTNRVMSQTGNGLEIGILNAQSTYANIAINNSGQFKIEKNGTNLVTVNSNGNFGIGTSSPSYKLDVVGEIKSDGYRIDLSGGTERVITSTGTDSIQFGDAGVNEFKFKNTAGTSMIINSSGNVGIGTTSPSQKVEVVGNAVITSTSGTTLKIQAKNATSFNDPRIEFVTWNEGSGASSGIIKLTNGAFNNNDMAFYTETSNSVTEKMRITSTGNIGIGTTSIDERLHVQGNVKFEQASGDIDVRYTSNGTNKYNMFYQAATDSWGLYYNPGGAYRLFVSSSGNVGISTNTPNEKLTVSGNIQLGDGGTGSSLNFNSTDRGTIKVNGSEKIRIDATGNVGVGVVNPLRKLHVGDIISGSDTHINGWGSVSASLSTLTTDLDVLENKNLLSGSAQIASDISGSITSFSASVSTRFEGLTTDYTELDNIPNDIVSSSAQIASDISGSITSFSGSIAGRVKTNESSISSLNGATGSYLLNTTDTLTGNLTVTGTLTAQEFNTEIVSSSIVFDSGSTKFGDSSDDVHDFTGSVNIKDGDILVTTTGGYFQIDTSDNSAKHADNTKAKFGTGNDFQIWHDGSNTYLSNEGVGHLNIQNTADDKNIVFKTDNGVGGTNEYMRIDGAGGLVVFSKDVKLQDNDILRLGDANDFKIYHDASNSYISQQGTGHLYIENTQDDSDIIFRSDDGSGGIENYIQIDGSEGRTLFNKNIRLNDNVILQIGNSGDFTAKHNGTDSYLENYTGNFHIANYADDGDIKFYSDNGSGGIAEYFRLDGGLVNGSAVLGAVKFPDKSKIFMGTGGDLEIFHDGNQSGIENYTGNLEITQHTNDGDLILKSDDGSGGVTPYLQLDGSHSQTIAWKNIHFDDDIKALFGNYATPDLQIYHNGTTGNSNIENHGGNLYFTQYVDDGSIYFRNDDGSGGVEEYLRLDGSTRSIVVSAALGMYFNDGIAGRFGNDGDMHLYHDGTNSVINNTTGDLTIQNNTDDGDIIFKSDDGSGGTAEYFRLDGGSTMNVFSKPIWQGDGVKSFFGNSQDLEIYHDGSNSYIDTSTSSAGDLYIKAQGTNHDLYLQSADDIFIRPQGGEMGIKVQGNDNVELYFNNVRKLRTTNTGAIIEGGLDADDITIDAWGSVSASLASIATAGGVNGSGQAGKITKWTAANTLGNSIMTEGTNTIQIISDGASAAGAILELKHANNNSTDVCGTINLTNNAGGYAAIEGGTTGANNSGYIAFKTDNAGTQGERMRIINNGNIGIATSTPSETLHIGAGHLLFERGVELRSKDTGGSQRTLARVNSSNQLEFGWSGNGPVKFMGGGSYTERMRIHTNGNVGIGYDAPYDILHLHNSTNSGTPDAQMNFTTGVTGAGDGNGFRVGWNGSVANLYLFENADMRFATNNNEKMRITAAGKLGLGTTSPWSRVSVEFSNTTTSQASMGGLLLANTDTTANNGSAITFAHSGAAGGSHTKIGAIYKDRTSSSEDTDLFFGTLGGGSYSEKMRITSTGNVGIGTTTPGSKLQVDQYTVGSNGTQNVFGNLSSFSNSGSENLFLGIKNASYPNRGWAFNPINNGVNSDLQIKEHGSTAVRMTLESGGNVGIGTTNPGSKLDVAGDINTSGNIILSGASNEIIKSNGSIRLNIDSDANQTDRVFIVSTGANSELFRVDESGNGTFAGTVSAEDNIHLTDAGTVRGKLLLNASDRDNVELRAESLGSTMKFFTVGTQALLLDASQNATFAGNVVLGDDKNLDFGAAPDFRIVHNSTTNVNHVSSKLDRQLSINANIIQLTNQANSTTYLKLESTGATFAGTVQAPVGSASAPTYTFTGKTDTGMYARDHSSNDRLAFSTDGTERGYFDSNGLNVATGNVYLPSGNSFRNYSGTWAATTGLSGNGFTFANTADNSGAVLLSITSDASSAGASVATFSGAVNTGGDITLTQTSGNNILYINSSGGGNPVIYMEDSTRKWGQFVSSGDLYFKNETANVNTLVLNGSNATFAGQITSTQNQITTNIGTTSAIRLKPGSTTNTTGKTSIFLGTSPVDDYGISLRGARLGSDGTPTFELATHAGSANGTVALSIDNSQNATFKGSVSIQADDADFLVRSNDYTISRIISRGSSGTNLDKGLFSLMTSDGTNNNVEAVRIDSAGGSWFNGGATTFGSDVTLTDGVLTVNDGNNYVKISEGSNSIGQIELKDSNPVFIQGWSSDFKVAVGTYDNTALTINSAKNATFANNVTVQGTLTAQQFHTEFVSSSILHESGSTSFGNSSDDVHNFTGSLNVQGNISHSGVTLTSGVDIDQVKEVAMTLTLTADTWTDTGINSTDLATGTYAIQLYVDDHTVNGRHFDEYYSGMMSWFGGGTNSTMFDEIPLHRAGHAPNEGDIQLRTQRHGSGGDNLMLQIKHTRTYSGALDNSSDGKIMRFKFRRLI